MTPSSVVRDITGAHPEVDLSRKNSTYHHGSFLSLDGYLITALEVRVRAGGFDAASFILLHVAADPCVSIDPLANAVGAVDEVSFPPSPHDPNDDSERGYALDTRAGGRLVISSRGEQPWACVTLITASSG